MSEDEAFIRAIVDGPGDDGPRLVYADWLEERGDPRASYLRAEQEGNRTGELSKLQELAIGLDPVWVARVTPPPLGVCCEHVEIRNRGPIITAKDIKRFELRFGFTLPDDYRAFLLNYNGGVVVENQLLTPDGEFLGGNRQLGQFHSLEPRPGAGQEGDLEWFTACRHVYISQFPPELGLETWFMRFIEIGRPRDLRTGILLGVTGPEFGEVWSIDYGAGFDSEFFDRNREPAAVSFAEYLAKLPQAE